MKEDPLERREREEAEKREKKSANLGLQIATGVLAAIAVGLGITLWTMNSKSSTLKKELEAEKLELEANIVELQDTLSKITSNYETINLQLDTSRAQVAELIENLKRTQATNRAKIRQYEGELGTLRSIMRNYLVQIDSLNTLNQKLTAEAKEARHEAAETRKDNEKLTKKLEAAEAKVSAGSVLKARGMRLEAYGESKRVTDRSSRTVRLLTTLSLIENSIIEPGPVTVYIRVTDPNGNLLTNSRSVDFTCKGQTLTASASREVDYAGAELTVSIYLNDIPDYTKGIYTAEAYTTAGTLGKAELMLR